MRLFKQQRKLSLNWRYIVGEVLLIFLGITLAIWFNNWNTASRINTEKESAMVRIKEEVQNNLDQLVEAQRKNQAVRWALQDLFRDNGTLTLFPSGMKELQKKHPGFAQIRDSTAAEDGKYRYAINAQINLEFPELTQIAWETTQTIGVAKEFDYNCLYEIERAYNLQRSFLQEMDKAAEAMQRQEINQLIAILGFSSDFGIALEKYYQNVLNIIDDCR